MKKANDNVILTIFTPTYNRASTLERTYQSMLRQDCKDFIWLIVDDGSTDNTAVLAKTWMENDNGFEIRYIHKENGGMHTAHNTAYDNIDTEINTCVDSDDMLAVGAVKKIIDMWNCVRNEGYAGIIALDADFDNKVIGRGFSQGLKATTVSGYYSKGGSGYPPYPVFKGEKYVSLSYKYRLIDQDYEMAVLDEIVCNVEYQPNGSTGSMLKQYKNNPNGFAFWRKIRMETADSTKRLFIDCIHYVSSSIIGKNKHYIKESPRKGMTVLAIPFGWGLSKYIKRKAK